VYRAYCRVVVMPWYESIGSIWKSQERYVDAGSKIGLYGRELSCERRSSWIEDNTEYAANLKIERESRRLN
jgi:hypothetical protein